MHLLVKRNFDIIKIRGTMIKKQKKTGVETSATYIESVGLDSSALCKCFTLWHCQLLRVYKIYEWNRSMQHWWNDTGRGKPEVVREAPVPLPPFPPQISNKINWDRSRTSAFKGWRLTTWATNCNGYMTLPSIKHMTNMVQNLKS